MNSTKVGLQLSENVNIIDEEFDPKKIVEKVLATGYNDAFYLLDVEDLKRKYTNWIEKMPRVKPFYAVKCNNNVQILKILAALGTGFDCASSEEIKQTMDIGVSSERIIYANPVKSPAEIRGALDKNVKTMTFDSEGELYRIKFIFPNARLVIRIRCDATISKWNLGKKFGCDPFKEAPLLLQLAKSLSLNVIGVSFHVGTLCGEIDVYDRAIQYARSVFDYAQEIGYDFTLLDIGGGFEGDKGVDMTPVATIINKALKTYFPDDTVQIIAEPGRYFVGSALLFVCAINSKREILDYETGDILQMMYYTNGGVYSGFVGNKIDGILSTPILIKKKATTEYNSIIWGPTCCAFDQVCENIKLPKLEVGDWMLFENMGAYTITFAFEFNGFAIPSVISYVNKDVWNEIMRS